MENHRLNKYWLIGPGVIAIILLVLASCTTSCLNSPPNGPDSAYRAALTMIRSNGIRDLIFMLL